MRIKGMLIFLIRLMIVSTCVFFSFYGYVWAGVQITFPENVSVLVVNGDDAQSGKYNLAKSINMPDGTNQIVIQYVGTVGANRFDNDAQLEYSDIFVIKFSVQNQSLKMTMPRIRSTFDLEKFNNAPDISILDPKNNKINLNIGKLEKDGFQIFRDYLKELDEFNKTQSPAALKTFNIQSPKEQIGKQNPQLIKQPANTNMPEEMLKYWYENADEKTQEKFKKWLDK